MDKGAIKLSEKITTNFSLVEENLLRQFLFTNPHGSDSFVYPQELVAGEELSPLMSAYSRTHTPFQDRVLQFLDTQKADVTRHMLPLIPGLMQQFRNADGSLKVSEKTASFNTEWVLAHGHNSIKEETSLFGHSEDISDITGKKITGHPLAKPQVKSTRYLSFENVLSRTSQDPDIAFLDKAVQQPIFSSHIADLNRAYLQATERLTNSVLTSTQNREIVAYLAQPHVVQAQVEKNIAAKLRKEPTFQITEEAITKEKEKYIGSLRDSSVKKDLSKFVLDFTRVYLPAVTRTSLGYSVDARTIEEIVTDMISSPRLEDQQRGMSIWKEAKKVAPILLGDKSHIKVNEWQKSNENLRNYFRERFSQIPTINHGKPMVKLVTARDVDMYSDRWNAALALFPFMDSSIIDLYAGLANQSDVVDVLKLVHKDRTSYDVLHPSISHGGLVTEFVMPFHGYRDMFRHRNGSRSVQLLTTDLGFEIPTIFKTFGLDESYLQMTKTNAELVRKAQAIDRHAAEKLVMFGANCRAIHTWQPNQSGYVDRLRSNQVTGNITYVLAAREHTRALEEIMPETVKFFRTNFTVYPEDMWKKGYAMVDANRTIK